MAANGKENGKAPARKRSVAGSDPRRNPRGAARPKDKGKAGRRGPDPVTAVLFLLAFALLALLVVFLRRDPQASAGLTDAAPPVVERTEERTEPNPAEDPVVELGIPEAPAPPADPESAEEPEAHAAGNATARLFFVKVSDEGKIGIKGVLRNVPATASPLTTAVNSLILGPAPGELSADMISLIPEGTALLGARVDGNVAFLDFNERFRFNALGIEGYRAQVEQIVYTATEFPTVEKVQFLVEGQRIDYLGGEGFWVGAPLGREDF